MPMKPRQDESQSDFMKRCMDETFTGDRSQEQAVAICMSYWRDEHGGKKPSDKSADEIKRIIALWCKLLQNKTDVPEPDEDESYDEFFDRCVSELSDLDESEAEDVCEMSWEDRSAPSIVHKVHAADVVGMEFVLSDESVDRMGDIIMSDGWDVQAFSRNPIALFNHNSSFPIGRWKNLRTENKMLRAHLELAPEGTSARIDEIRKLVDAGILRAASVGFRPVEVRPRIGDKGLSIGDIFIKSELIETSLVSIPANSNALAVAKSLNISPATIDLVFAGQGNKKDGIKRRGVTGGKAEKTRDNGKGKAMNSLAQRISDLQVQLTEKKDALNVHLEGMDNSNVTDSDLETNNKLNAEIQQFEKTLASWLESEKLLAKNSDANANGKDGTTRGRSLSTFIREREDKDKTGLEAPSIILNGRKKELDPIEYLVRAGTVAYAAKVWNRPLDETRHKIYGEDEPTKLVSDMVLRAATAPALTTVTGWAAELAQLVVTDMMPTLIPDAVFTKLSARGLSLNFGRAAKIVIPTRSRTPTLAGSFVGEGQPIPVRQGAFTSSTLTPKKMAVITTFSREIDEHSIPAIEGVLRQAVQEDTGVAIDTVLLDAVAASVIRPAGLLNGVTVTTATAGGGLTALVGDLKALVGALTTGTFGNIRNPVWLMNPVDALSISLVMTTVGVFPFKEEIGRDMLLNIPVIKSSTVTAKTLILLDAADFVSVGGDAPRMEISDQATLHLEDTTPLEIIAAGTPNVTAAPVRSLWQTDTLALRMILPLNWALRRTGQLAWTQTVTW